MDLFSWWSGKWGKRARQFVACFFDVMVLKGYVKERYWVCAPMKSTCNVCLYMIYIYIFVCCMSMYVHIFICLSYLHTPGGIWGCICCHLGDYNRTIFGSPTASYTRWLEPPKPIQKSLQHVLLDLSLKSLRNLGCWIVCILFTQDKLVLDEWRLQHFLVAESRHTKLSKKLRVSYLDYWGCFIYTKRG